MSSPSIQSAHLPLTTAARHRQNVQKQGGVRAHRFFLLASLPAVVVVAVVILVPLVISVGLSFTGYSIDVPNRVPFVGLENYRNLFTDPEFPTVLVNTFEYALGAVLAEVVVGVGFAVLLASHFRG